MHESFVFSDEKVCRAPMSRTAWLASARARLVALLKRCADYCAAAAAYDDLSRLSDGELKHRGLSRDVLVRDLSAWRDRGSGRVTTQKKICNLSRAEQPCADERFIEAVLKVARVRSVVGRRRKEQPNPGKLRRYSGNCRAH